MADQSPSVRVVDGVTFESRNPLESWKHRGWKIEIEAWKRPGGAWWICTNSLGGPAIEGKEWAKAILAAAKLAEQLEQEARDGKA